MGEYDPASDAPRYLDWYKDHSGRRSDWFRKDLVWRLETRRPLKGLKVLDFGCGTGSSTVVLTEKGAAVLGVETEEISIDIAARRAQDLHVQDRCAFVRIPYLSGQGAWLPFKDASFDLCTLIGVLEHMRTDERIACAAEIERVLKPGGDLFIFDTPNRAFPKDHHTTQLWFIGWLPESIARAYSIARRRFDPAHDFRRYGANGMSRNEIDRLFPPGAWQLSYEKAADEVLRELAPLRNGSLPLPSPVRRVIASSMTALTSWFLGLVTLLRGRPAYWTASHALCFTKSRGRRQLHSRDSRLRQGSL